MPRCCCFRTLLLIQLVQATLSSGTSVFMSLNLTAVPDEACRQRCDKLDGFLERMGKVLETNSDSALDSFGVAHLCRHVQAEHKIISCITTNPQACKLYAGDLSSTNEHCKKIGIDLTQEPTSSNYTGVPCAMCSTRLGAVSLETYWSKPTLHQCEAYCHSKHNCVVFDYDATRSLCRTWAACGDTARSDRFGCQWTTYIRPSSNQFSTAPEITVGSGAGVSASENFDYWSTTTEPSRPVMNAELGVASAASSLRSIWDVLPIVFVAFSVNL